MTCPRYGYLLALGNWWKLRGQGNGDASCHFCGKTRRDVTPLQESLEMLTIEFLVIPKRSRVISEFSLEVI